MRLRLLNILIIPSLALSLALSAMILLLHPGIDDERWVRTIIPTNIDERSSIFFGVGSSERWSHVVAFGQRWLSLTDRQARTIQIIDYHTGELIQTLDTTSFGVGFYDDDDAEDTRMVAVNAIPDNFPMEALEVWDVANGTRLLERSFDVNERFAFRYVVTPDHPYVVFGIGTEPHSERVDGLQLMDAQTADYGELLTIPLSDFTAVDLASGDGLLLAAAGTMVRSNAEHAMIWVWRMDDNSELRPYAEHELGTDIRSMDAIDISPDGRTLAYVATYAPNCPQTSHTLRLMDIESGESSALPVIGRPLSVTFSPDGTRLAVTFMSACEDQESIGVEIIDVATRAITDILPHERFYRVTALRFSDDGQQLYTAVPNGSVMVWELNG